MFYIFYSIWKATEGYGYDNRPKRRRTRHLGHQYMFFLKIHVLFLY